MAYGFNITNDSGRIQVDQDFRAPRLIASGSSTLIVAGAYQAVYTTPYSMSLEPPVVMIRPSLAGKYVGGGLFSGTGFAFYGQCPFEYAVFSTRGAAVDDGSTFGIEVYGADGAVSYSSRHSHPRIRKLFSMPPTTAAGGGYEKTATITGFSSMPWILANPLIQTSAGVSEYSEGMGGVMAAIDASFTQLSVELINMDPYYWAGPYPTLRSFIGAELAGEYDPYFDRPSFFAVGTYA